LLLLALAAVAAFAYLFYVNVLDFADQPLAPTVRAK
jgi:hypothetical protein